MDNAVAGQQGREDAARPQRVTEGEVCGSPETRSPRREDPPLVLIEWEDSADCTPSWTELVVDRPTPLRCMSAGWLIHKDEHCAVIVSHVILEEDERQGCGEMTIPARSILRIVALRPATTRPFGRRIDSDEARMNAMIK